MVVLVGRRLISEAPVYTEALQWKTPVSSLRLWAWITGPKTDCENKQYFLTFSSHSCDSIKCISHGTWNSNWSLENAEDPRQCGLFFFVCTGVMCSPCCLLAVGHLYSNTKRTVGILDLGGGSTQITFLPKSKVNKHFYRLTKCFSPKIHH